MKSYRACMILLGLAVTGCSPNVPRPETPSTTVHIEPAQDGAVSTDWTAVMLPDDSERIAALPARWAAAIEDARRSGFARATADDGALLEPSAGLARPTPPPGRYRCRIVRIGKQGGGPAYERFKPFFCFIQVEGDLLTFVKGTGTRRPGGRLWADGDKRLVFMGGVAEGDQESPPAYGADAAHDTVGVVERVGDFVWRLALPGRNAADGIEIIELIPDTPAPPPVVAVQPKR